LRSFSTIKFVLLVFIVRKLITASLFRWNNRRNALHYERERVERNEKERERERERSVATTRRLTTHWLPAWVLPTVVAQSKREREYETEMKGGRRRERTKEREKERERERERGCSQSPDLLTVPTHSCCAKIHPPTHPRSRIPSMYLRSRLIENRARPSTRKRETRHTFDDYGTAVTEHANNKAYFRESKIYPKNILVESSIVKRHKSCVE